MTFDPENTDTALPIYSISYYCTKSVFYCLKVEKGEKLRKIQTLF